MRIRGRHAVWACSIGGLLAACAAQKSVPPSTEVEEGGFRDHVRVLAGNDFEGRKPGTHGEQMTVAYLVEQFRKLGLKPGNGESYLQAVPMREILPGTEAFLSFSGRGVTRRLVYGKDMVIWSKDDAPQSDLKQSDLVFVGYGIVAPQGQRNDYAALDVRGKTVIVMLGDPGFKDLAPGYLAGWPYKFEEAARHGAAGVLLIHEFGTASFGWDHVVSRWSGPQFATATATADGQAGLAPIEGWISNAAAQALVAQAGFDLAALEEAAARPDFKAVSMALKTDALLHHAVRRFTSSNVIAVLPGGKRTHEYVMYTAHWDGLGQNGAEAGGALLNGAVDNASGVAGMLELAQSFSRMRPPAERSIVFLALTAGEAGGLGSAYYVENPVFSLKHTAAVLNLDTLHIGGPTRDVVLWGEGHSELEEYLRTAALLQGREVHARSASRSGSYPRSDDFSFASHGIPALYAKAGIDDSARGPVWGQAQLDDYLAHRYRQPSDTYSPDWDVRGTLDDLRLYFEVGNRLSRSGRFPRWYPDSGLPVAELPPGAKRAK